MPGESLNDLRKPGLKTMRKRNVVPKLHFDNKDTVLDESTAEDNFSTSSEQYSEKLDYDDTIPPPEVNTMSQDTKLSKIPNKPLTNFIWTTSPQPHAVRRRIILQKFPELEELYGTDPSQAITAMFTIFIQLTLCYYISKVNISLWTYLITTFIVSGTLNHSLFAAMHEGSHRTIFHSKLASELFCIFTTVPMGLPAAIPFKRYHLDHHIYQGVTHLDPDIPTEAEAWFFRSPLRKFLWILLMPATYSLRPLITRPKQLLPIDIFAWALCISVDGSIFYFWGLKSLLYLLIGTLFSMNFHPFAGHFISEHFILPQLDVYQETSSYYGVWNLFTYNVGYHNEHHDFPRIPGSRLPLVKEIASEFYSMPDHKTWESVVWRFIFEPTVTPFNRIKRIGVRGGNLPASLKKHKYHEQVIPCGGIPLFWPQVSDFK